MVGITNLQILLYWLFADISLETNTTAHACILLRNNTISSSHSVKGNINHIIKSTIIMLCSLFSFITLNFKPFTLWSHENANELISLI